MVRIPDVGAVVRRVGLAVAVQIAVRGLGTLGIALDQRIGFGAAEVQGPQLVRIRERGGRLVRDHGVGQHFLEQSFEVRVALVALVDARIFHAQSLLRPADVDRLAARQADARHQRRVAVQGPPADQHQPHRLGPGRHHGVEGILAITRKYRDVRVHAGLERADVVLAAHRLGRVHGGHAHQLLVAQHATPTLVGQGLGALHLVEHVHGARRRPIRAERHGHAQIQGGGNAGRVAVQVEIALR